MKVHPHLATAVHWNEQMTVGLVDLPMRTDASASTSGSSAVTLRIVTTLTVQEVKDH